MSPKSRVVIVGYDGSATSKRAVTFAARRAGREGRLVLVHADEGIDGRFLRGTRSDEVFDPELEQFAEGRAFETRLVAEPPARALVRAARENDADEIVVGTRRLGLVHGGLGSVAHRLLKEADRPVTVVPPGFDPDHPNAA